jgi:hypothetical protein
MCADNNKKFQQPFAEKGELRSVAAERGFGFISSPTISCPALIRPEKTLVVFIINDRHPATYDDGRATLNDGM